MVRRTRPVEPPDPTDAVRQASEQVEAKELIRRVKVRPAEDQREALALIERVRQASRPKPAA